MSCTCQLNGTNASITPVSPPTTKISRKPAIHSIGTLQTGRPLHSVAIHAKSWIPVGMATSMLATAKKACDKAGMPTANMWCTHRPKLMKPVPIIDTTTQR